MVACNFNGRLGNNLFQIATIASIANQLGVEFIVPELTYAGHRGDIPVDLSIFDYKFNIGKLESPIEYNEPSFEYAKIEGTDNLNISGFFQSWKYFEDIKDLLINKYFKPSTEISNILAEYYISENSLGISVRRGDYLMLQHNHCVLTADYYQNVINTHFKDNIDQIYIFSDDIEWCKSVFGDQVNYVESSIGAQLFLMGKMKHLILSNSTFAWWGGYLNQTNGTIVAPTPWFGPNNEHINTNDLYYPSWIKFNHIIQQQQYSVTPNMYN
jgi:hypothetical protein